VKAWLAAMTREEVRAILVRALEQEAGCVRAASDRLGITKMAVSVMVRKHGLQQDVARVREAAARRFRLL
jgi:transcriptional regulator with GAF, ATPase, and Fis domain